MHVSLVAATGILDPVIAGKDLLIFLLVKAAVFWIFVAIILLSRKLKAPVV